MRGITVTKTGDVLITNTMAIIVNAIIVTIIDAIISKVTRAVIVVVMRILRAETMAAKRKLKATKVAIETTIRQVAKVSVTVVAAWDTRL